MSKQITPKKLGMGLSALLGPSSVKVENNAADNALQTVRLLDIDKIVAGIYQPRKYFDQDSLNELAESIKENSLIQPIIVRKADDESEIYEIIAGERRYRAARIAGLKQIPVIIKDIDNAAALEFAIIENVQREDLSAIEEANSYKQLMNEFNYTQEQISAKIGCSRSRVANSLRLLMLPDEIQDMIKQGLISSGHGRVLANKDNALEIANKIIKEDLSVRQTEELFSSQKVQSSPKLNKSDITPADLKRRELKNQYLRAVESNLSAIIGDKLAIKATFDNIKQKGKITISYNSLDDLEDLIKKISTNS